MNYILTIVIVVIVMSFAMRLYDSLILRIDFSGSGGIHPMFAVLQASGMASELAGGGPSILGKKES